MGEEDRRQSFRHDLRVNGKLTEKGGQAETVTVDISESGVGFEAGRPVSPGIAITLIVGEGRQFRFEGNVVWCLQMNRDGLPAYRMGMQADSVSDDDETAVEKVDQYIMMQRVLEVLGGRMED